MPARDETEKGSSYSLKVLGEEIKVNSPLIGSKMLATLPPVLYGIFRYLYLIYDRKDTRSTDAILLGDYGMIGAAVVWVVSALVLLLIYH